MLPGDPALQLTARWGKYLIYNTSVAFYAMRACLALANMVLRQHQSRLLRGAIALPPVNQTCCRRLLLGKPASRQYKVRHRSR